MKKLCFVLEDCYRHDNMPLAVAHRLIEWGHDVDILDPMNSIARVSDLLRDSDHDAWILKSVSGGPGLSLLEAAAASGLRTINDARSIPAVRDKAVAAAVARRHGLPFPLTYFAAAPELLHTVPLEHYPLVVKPANGSSGRCVRLVATPDDLLDLQAWTIDDGWLLAQTYVPNPGVDIKVYNTGDELYATVQRSPLHPDILAEGHLITLSSDLARLVTFIGVVFRLDLYGVDVVEGPNGWVVVDVNDFPSFNWVPDAPARVARSVLRLANGNGSAAGPALGVDTAGKPSRDREADAPAATTGRTGYAT
jgi:ribosomal protein S6--L-glutamate ligase